MIGFIIIAAFIIWLIVDAFRYSWKESLCSWTGTLFAVLATPFALLGWIIRWIIKISKRDIL